MIAFAHEEMYPAPYILISPPHQNGTREYRMYDRMNGKFGGLDVVLTHTADGQFRAGLEDKLRDEKQYDVLHQSGGGKIIVPRSSSALSRAYDVIARLIVGKETYFLSDELKRSDTPPEQPGGELFKTRKVDGVERTLFTAQGEQYHFDLLNWLKHQMVRTSRRVPYMALAQKREAVQHVVELRDRIHTVKNTIARVNEGLMYDRARANGRMDDEYFSELGLALSMAINKFDPTRGFKFSTYACNAMNKNGYRVYRGDHRRAKHETPFDTEKEQVHSSGIRGQERTDLYAERIAKIMSENGAGLTRRERAIVKWRHFNDGNVTRTLNQLGRKFRISRERVRQIEGAALEKLRMALNDEIDELESGIPTPANEG